MNEQNTLLKLEIESASYRISCLQIPIKSSGNNIDTHHNHKNNNRKKIKSDKFFHRDSHRKLFPPYTTTEFDIYAIKEAPFTLNRVLQLYITRNEINIHKLLFKKELIIYHISWRLKISRKSKRNCRKLS